MSEKYKYTSFPKDFTEAIQRLEKYRDDFFSCCLTELFEKKQLINPCPKCDKPFDVWIQNFVGDVSIEEKEELEDEKRLANGELLFTLGCQDTNCSMNKYQRRIVKYDVENIKAIGSCLIALFNKSHINTLVNPKDFKK